ncbi:DUF4296 domain-containing protein [Maribacter sp. 2304DJ31-5]|uniref:DUF4296 domain-containing protein n=1 Tax=Maribacter sp. 2304DJ31-5 TaxID=3386273 RepID=UPI0039BCD998
MKKQFIFLITLFFLFACREKLVEAPENLIPKEEMIKILKDMAILNAAKTTDIGRLKKYEIDPTNYVFEKYAIDSAQFVESDRYYASVPLEYESIYSKVKALLEEERAHMEERQKIIDSIKYSKALQLKDKDSLKVLSKIKNGPQ